MNSERWQQIEKIYHAALEKSNDQRSAFLDHACAGDQELRKEVESLLDYEPRAQNFIESPALEVAAKMMTEATATPNIGNTIGPYKILSHVASGGMGEVYLAEDTRLGRKVILKILPERFTQDADRNRRFLLEARATSSLNHPNILTIYDVGKAGNVHYIANEFIGGETLRQKMARGKIPISEVLEIATQAAAALAAAHEAGVLHRDIKPDNIMVRTDGLVKVLDLGLAKLMQPEESRSAQMKTETGLVLGTPDHMSPEQARGQDVDARTDLFALGVVIYEMAAGKPPFAGETIADVIASILSAEPVPLSESAPESPAALESILAKALRKKREERYQSAKEMLNDLNHLKRRFEFEKDVEKSGPAAARRSARKSIKSLAILPFTNTGTDPSMDYFSDGITESLINALSQLPSLRVVSRTTAFRYKETSMDPKQIGRELNVRAVLTGRLRQIEDRLIISVELTDVERDSQLWGEQYNRKLSDIIEIQQEITNEIAGKLRLRLSHREKSRLTKRYTENVEAYHLYLKGRYYWSKRTEENVRKAIEYFKHAIETDPTYALAYVGMADAYCILGSFGIGALAPEQAFPKAREAATRALQIDDSLVEARAPLAFTLVQYYRDWTNADLELRRCMQERPDYATAFHWYGLNILAPKGRFDEAIAQEKHALTLEPLSLIINTNLGTISYLARDYDRAIRQYHETIEMDSNFVIVRWMLGLAYMKKELFDDSIREFEKAIALSERSPVPLSMLAHAFAASGRRDEAERILSELEDLSQQRYVSPYRLAIVYVGMKKSQKALEYLHRAYEEHDAWFNFINIDPSLDGLRGDSRFAELLSHAGFRSSPSVSAIRTQLAVRKIAPTAVAVLPFRPISPESRDEYLELGIADALITKLSDIQKIVVRPTSAIRKYLDVDQDPTTAGRELAVESVLEGSIRRLGNRIRVTARLIRTEDGRSLWAGKFDENFTDIFAVEDSISEKVAASLALKLSSEERERLTKRYTENVDAYHLYLKGRYYCNKRSATGLHKSIECFRQALEIEPNYAPAYTGLADAYTYLGDAGITAIPPKEAFSKGRAAAAKALEIDDGLAETHVSLAHLHLHHFEWAEAEQEFQRAFELKPNYAAAHQIHAYYLLFTKRVEEAITQILHALELDPLSVPINADAANMFFYARRYDEAIEQFRKTLEMEPQSVGARLHLARAFEQEGMFEEAIAECQTAVRFSDNSTGAIASLGRAFALAGNTEEALRLLRELEKNAHEKYVSPYDLAVLYAALGQKDDAFNWLQRAYEDRAEWMIYLTVDPRLDPLRSDARFTYLARQIGLS